jgi:hypothetical protein
MVQVCLLNILGLPPFYSLVTNSYLNNYFMFLLFTEIFFPYVNLLLIILFSLNFTLLTLLSRIARLGLQSTKANLKMAFINSFLHMCIYPHLKHSLVRGLHHIVGTNDWDIQPFRLSTMFYPSFNFQFLQIRHCHLAPPALRLRVISCPFLFQLLSFVIL